MDRRVQLSNNNSSIFLSEPDRSSSGEREASCLFALITGRRSVSRRNRASWYLRQLNKQVKCDSLEEIEQNENALSESSTDQEPQEDVSQQQHSKSQLPMPKSDEKDIFLVSMVSDQIGANCSNQIADNSSEGAKPGDDERFLVTTNTRVHYLSKSIATSIILDLSPSVVSVSPQDNCVLLDSMFDALKRILHLLVKEHEFPSSQADRQFTFGPTVFVSVIAYTPFVVAKNNQVLVQNRRISSLNIEQVLVELWLCINRLIQELHDLVMNTSGINYDYDNNNKPSNSSAFVFPPPLTNSIIRHPGSVLDDIYELGLFSASLMPRLTRLSIIVITDGLFSSSNDLSAFRLKSIAMSFVSLADELINLDNCFGYTTYNDLMKFAAKSTQGVYISHSELIASSCNLSRTKQIPLMSNPLFKLFSWSLHSDIGIEDQCKTPRLVQDFNRIPSGSSIEFHSQAGTASRPECIAPLFCIDQPVDAFNGNGHLARDMESATNQSYHDWRSFKQMSKNLDADFEQVLACLLREGYLIKSIHLKNRESSNISARLVLHWKHNLNLEQELNAPYWNSADPFEMRDSSSLILKPFLAPSYGDTYCEVFIHGSYNFLHDFYCDKKVKRRSDYRSVAYQQFEQLILGVKHTYDRLQYLSRYYRNMNLSRVPTFLQHGNSLLFEQPHTHNLISTIENLVDKTPQSWEFSEYWQEISQIELRNWRNLMHIHTLRLILEHDQPKHKNIHCQNANGRYTHIQCRRAMSAISNFIKSYASFALLEDSLYIKFIHTKEDDLREVETSATKGFVVIRIKKLLPIVVVYLMFTSGILDSHRVQIVNYIERQLVSCKLGDARVAPSSTQQNNGSQPHHPQHNQQHSQPHHYHYNYHDHNENILKSKIIYATGEACCVIVRSPLERMLRVYSRNMISEFLSQNLTYGLPGSCPYSTQQKKSSLFRSQATQQQQRAPITEDIGSTGTQAQQRQNQNSHKSPTMSVRDQLDDCSMDSGNTMTVNRYNPVFGKYLYGIRVIHTLSGLPHELVHQIVLNILAKISAILVNFRIKQGFHIAFNNSGLLTLVNELDMRDYSNQLYSSNCLCQYLVFPPTVTNSGPQHGSVFLSQNLGPSNGTSTGVVAPPTGTTNGAIVGSVAGSLSGSIANSDHSYMRNTHDVSSPTIQGSENQGEIKVIREYWIEQQYGISAKSEHYHKSLVNMRYSEVVDHLYLTDTTIFNCLLNYDLLQLLCDRMSPFYELDVAMAGAEPQATSLFSPTNSTSSSELLDNSQFSPTTPSLPSNLLEGTTRDSPSRIPLIELEYKFSLVDFLDYCHYATLDVLLFKNDGPFYEPIGIDDSDIIQMEAGRSSSKPSIMSDSSKQQQHQQQQSTFRSSLRKMSVDVNSIDSDHTRREHRSSYDSINTVSMGHSFGNPFLYQSLNHLFLETLHKRLKQFHDKELKIPELDRKRITEYLQRRKMKLEIDGGDDYVQDLLSETHQDPVKLDTVRDSPTRSQDNEQTCVRSLESLKPCWRCFMRKGNQENLMIVLIPASLEDIKRWMLTVERISDKSNSEIEICPIFVFRCSSSMINEKVLSLIGEPSANERVQENIETSSPSKSGASNLENDLSLHFGQPCRYMNKLRATNDELDNEILPLSRFSELSQGISDGKTLELVNFRAFLRKIKNTVLKSRFTSLNDAYLSGLFVNKDDFLYYISNVDADIQKKYHVSSHLRSLAEFIKSYEEYHESLPKEPSKPCNQLLNSILLQKCGLYINQPLARFDEANPLMSQLHDKKLLAFMRRNYKIELPILNENLSNSRFLRGYLSPAASGDLLLKQASASNHRQRDQPLTMKAASPSGSGSTISNSLTEVTGGPLASSLGRTTASNSRMMDMKYGSIGTASLVGGSPVGSVVGHNNQHHHHRHHHQERASKMMPRISGSQQSFLNLTISPSHDGFFLEAFKNSNCSMEEIVPSYMSEPVSSNEVSLRHEAHMAEVLKRKSERKESHHYRRVLKSKANYNQSHSAIDQALRRVDSLGRLEHFCLTPLLFSPAWRSNLAPVRDHTIETTSSYHCQRDDTESTMSLLGHDDDQQQPQQVDQLTNSNNTILAQQDEASERWHQMICNNYIKEYEQYIQTLGFNSVQIRFPSSSRLQTSLSSSSGFGVPSQQQTTISSNTPANIRKTSLQTISPVSQSSMRHVSRKAADGYLKRDSSANLASSGNSFIPISSSSTLNLANATPNQLGTSGNYNTGYLIKFLNSGCLVFKVGFCKPYVYSILYSIEGERFNNSNLKMNMTAFLDELDNIKVTLHLHSFTYDYHLRSMYSYISRRQINFNPGYHLISFIDDFRKYYQKAPNYARNHILSGEVNVTNLKVDGQQLYNYIVTHNSTYQLDVLEMTSSNVANLIANFNAGASSTNTNGSNNNYPRSASQQFTSFLSAQFGGGSNKQGDDYQQPQGGAGLSGRNHANDYVLIELKREKVRYKDGKDPDIFDCGLLIAHDHVATSASKNSLVLKYFLILTNQRDLYPKLFHPGDSIISLGCHRPIRLGLANQVMRPMTKLPVIKNTKRLQSEPSDTGPNETDQGVRHTGSSVTTDMDADLQSEFLSSGELSGPHSIISTVNSVQSSGSIGGASSIQMQTGVGNPATTSDTEASMASSVRVIAPSSLIASSNLSMVKTEEAAEALPAESPNSSWQRDRNQGCDSSQDAESRLNSIEYQQHSSSVSTATTNVDQNEADSINGTGANRESSCSSALLPDQDNRIAYKSVKDEKRKQPHERTICDEEITYLGYFSSDEMDMLKFLQEKTANLKSHLEQIVQLAEVHFRRDCLWHKLMQRQVPPDQTSLIMSTRSSSSSDQLPLTVDELIQLLAIVDAIDLATLDPNLQIFTTMHITWYMKLLKAFNELRQSPSGCSHRIYTVKASKILLLYIDPKCTTSFILLSINTDRGSVEMSLLLKDKHECYTSGDSGSHSRSLKSVRNKHECSTSPTTGGDQNPTGSSPAILDLDADCRQLISDFVNFCATFMWSNLLT